MTISSSLNAGVSGLAANANRLATISDNIANSSTYGYKRAEASFHSMVISSGDGTYSAGGVRVTSTRLIDEPGALLSTSNSTDLAVRGNGFLPVATSAEVNLATGNYDMHLATTGSFRTDADGYLVTESGTVLLGWPADADGTIPIFPRDTSEGLEPVQINTNQFAGEPTTRVSLGVNLPATDTAAGSDGESYSNSIEYFDNLGTSQSINVTYTPSVAADGDPSTNTWLMEMTDTALNGALVGSYVMTFNDTRDSGGTLASVTSSVGNPGTTYDDTTGSFEIDVAGGPITITIGGLGDGTGVTQLSDSFAPTAISKDGSPVGNMISVEVDENGYVTANFDIGITRTIFQIPLVSLSNPNGLTSFDNQIYKDSAQSGSFFLWDAADGPTGDIVGYALEESATDVAGELTELIQTQRAYSSNAKVIQTVELSFAVATDLPVEIML